MSTFLAGLRSRRWLNVGVFLLGVRNTEGFDWLDPTVYAVSGGCVPIRVGGAMVGTATVSGLPDHEDHALVIEAMRALLA